MVLGENPDAQDGQAEEEEEDNEEEDDAGVEDAADANNGAQGSGCSMPSLTLEGSSFLTCTEDRESGVSCLMMGQSCYDRFLFYKLAVTGRRVHKCAFCETEHFVYYSPLHRTSLLSLLSSLSIFPFLSLPLFVH